MAKLFVFILSIWIIIIIQARDVALSYVPVVMLGYDVVAYHLNVTGCNSVEGKQQYSYQLQSADQNGTNRLYEFWFANENNLNIFTNNPWQYVPRFGGFCSYGTCCELPEDGWPWSSDFQGPPAGPDSSNCGFRVHTDGYLYFNINNNYDVRFFEDAEKNLAAAKERWIRFFGSLEAGPINHYCFSTIGTVNECVQYGERFAPAVNPQEEIYPVDTHYVDMWYSSHYNVTTLQTTHTGLVSSIYVSTGTSEINPKHTNMDHDKHTEIVFIILVIVGAIFGVIIFVFCLFYHRRNKSLKQDFELLNGDEVFSKKIKWTKFAGELKGACELNNIQDDAGSPDQRKRNETQQIGSGLTNIE